MISPQEAMDILVDEFGAEFLEEAAMDSVQPGICRNCEEIQDQCEPDVSAGDYRCCDSSHVDALMTLVFMGASFYED